MIKYILTGVYILFTTTGLLLIKLGGDTFKVSLKPTFSFNMGYVTMIGFLCYIISFLLWQKLLVTFDLSYIVPIATGIVQVIVLLMGIFVFKEQINAMGIIGSIMIIIGIVLLAFGKR